MSLRFSLAAVLVLSLHQALAAEVVAQPGSIDAVTVYRGQALVTRVVDVPGPAGLREVVVTDLPEAVVPGSVYAESADGVAVRSVRYRVRQVAEDVREEVRQLDERIAEQRRALDANQRRRGYLEHNRGFLEGLESFTSAAASLEVNHGILKADTIRELTLFLFGQQAEISDALLQVDREREGIAAQIDLLERKRHELAGASARTAREAVVFVDLKHDAGGRMRVRYLVNNATWSPSYNVRAGGAADQALLEYNAAVQQRSGEDWTDVEMTLSTATPALVAKAPTLTPLKVALADMPQVGGKGDYLAQQAELLGRKRALEGNRNNPILNQGFQQQRLQQQQQQVAGQSAEVWEQINNTQNDLALNSISAELQVLDLMARPHDARQAARLREEEGVSVTYRLEGRTSLPSRSDRQSIQIAAVEAPADYYKVATPVLTGFVYDEAELTNASELVLLAGPSMAFADGEFVGHGEIATVAAGERFTVGLGIDASLRATRTLVDKSERIQGGNRIVTFKYRVAVENFAGAAAEVRVLDRLPQSPQGSQVQVTLARCGQDLSGDRVYEKTQRDEGILRWDALVPAGVNGPDAFAIDYEFTLEYDREKAITGLALGG